MHIDLKPTVATMTKSIYTLYTDSRRRGLKKVHQRTDQVMVG